MRHASTTLTRRIALTAAALVAGLIAPSGASAAGKYASVNGLKMYYEVHGKGRPLVLIHGGVCTIEICFGKLIPGLAKTRQVIVMELQAHGRTADIDRPMTFENLAGDVVGLLRHLDVKNADIYGYSIGGRVGLEIAIRHPELVRKLVVAAAGFNKEAVHPEIAGGMQQMTPAAFAGSPWLAGYNKVAANPADFPKLVERIKEIDRTTKSLSPEAVRSIKAPTMVLIADSDIIRPEHAVELFRLLGGGVPGDVTGLPRAQLAVVPGTTHVTLLERTDALLAMVPAFLDAPTPKPQAAPNQASR